LKAGEEVERQSTEKRIVRQDHDGEPSRAIEAQIPAFAGQASKVEGLTSKASEEG